MKSCRTCKHYDLDGVKDAAGRVRTHRVAPCRFPLESIVFPASLSNWSRPARLQFMAPNYGADCMTHEEREAGQ